MADKKPTKAELTRWVQESAARRNLRTAAPADIYLSWLEARRYLDQGVRIFQFRDWLAQQVQAKVLYAEPEKAPGNMTPMERALTWQDELGYWIGAVGLMSSSNVRGNMTKSRIQGSRPVRWEFNVRQWDHSYEGKRDNLNVEVRRNHRAWEIYNIILEFHKKLTVYDASLFVRELVAKACRVSLEEADNLVSGADVNVFDLRRNEPELMFDAVFVFKL